MTQFNINNWSRIEFDRLPIYIHKSDADWFVPNTSGDEILKSHIRNTHSPCQREIEPFLMRLPERPLKDYPGRSHYLTLSGMSELWFHITNQCNLSCNHCLFSCSPKGVENLSFEKIKERALEAYEMGCRVFSLTGGEPFIHPRYKEIVKYLLSFKDAQVVTLTNGTLLKEILSRMDVDYRRFHLQVSLDGLEVNHNEVRGKDTFFKVKENLLWLKENSIPYTLSMCINRQNIEDVPAIVDFAADMGAGNVHYMWVFIKGRATSDDFVSPNEIFTYLIKAAKRATVRGVGIDNIEALKGQIFAPSGTLHDGTTSGWQSAAIGVDDHIYPSAAMVGSSDMGTKITKGLAHAFEESPILTKVRNATMAKSSHPLRYFLGGGDFDHSVAYDGSFSGSDPYLTLYEKIVLWLIKEHVPEKRNGKEPRLLLKMGEILESCGAGGAVSLTHSNCLLATVKGNSLSNIKSFYSEAALTTKEDILNPVCYTDESISHIPKAYRFRGYGCGSPVLDAGISLGEHVLDLGCGSGVECFIASKMVGPSGWVTGIDMLDHMLARSNKGKIEVAENLGYDNLHFKKGYLESLPLADDSVHAVLSNCVMNLSTNKRLAYAEIFRVLKKGGRLVISDVVCDSEPSPEIRNDETLQGECIGGAMTQKDLMGILRETGFDSIRLIKRFFYREVKGHRFFSLTYTAFKRKKMADVPVIYQGPLPFIETPGRKILPAGVIRFISKYDAEQLDDQLFLLDDDGSVLNGESEGECGCCLPPESSGVEKTISLTPADPVPKGMGLLKVGASSCCTPLESPEALKNNVISFTPKSVPLTLASPKKRSGCMVCGAELCYFSEEKPAVCVYCHQSGMTSAMCENAHFVCDGCHQKEGIALIEHACLISEGTDLVTLFNSVRKHPSFPVHGPEHHALVPGVILAVYKNSGGKVSASQIKTAIKRGGEVAGGYCGFMGICGSAIGVGIAFSLILEASPVKAGERQIVQSVTARVLSEISKFKAARCCQREVWIALKTAADLSHEFLGIALKAEGRLKCTQKKKNKECLGQACPLW